MACGGCRESTQEAGRPKFLPAKVRERLEASATSQHGRPDNPTSGAGDGIELEVTPKVPAGLRNNAPENVARRVFERRAPSNDIFGFEGE
jgi:hypothetical protein